MQPDAAPAKQAARERLREKCYRAGWREKLQPTLPRIADRLQVVRHALRSAVLCADADAVERAIADLGTLEESLTAFAALYGEPRATPAPVVLPASRAAVELVAPAPPPADVRCMTRAEAAKRCGVSLRAFDRHVRPHIPEIKLGAAIRYTVDDVEGWLLSYERDKRGEGAKLPERKARPRQALASGVKLTDPKALAILNRLNRKGGKHGR